MSAMVQRLGALEQSVAADQQGINNLLQLVEDTMPMEEALADRSFVRQLATRVQQLEQGVAPAVSDMQAQVDGLQRALAEQARSHAAALAELHAMNQPSKRHEQTDTIIQAALANQRRDLEERASVQLLQQVEQLRLASAAAGAKCTDLSESVATYGRRMDSVETRVERKLAAATREVRVLSNRLQAELDSTASQRHAVHVNQHGSTLTTVNAAIGQFEMGQAPALHSEPEPEPEPELKLSVSAILGTVESLEVEVAAQSKRLDALSLDLATRGREVAASSRLISQSARSLAMRTGSEPAEATEATPMLRRSLRAIETRVLELEDCTRSALSPSIEMRMEELEERKVNADELSGLVKNLIDQEVSNGSLVARPAKADEDRLLAASHQMSRLQSNLSALVERSAAQNELRMNEIARRVGAVEDQSQHLALTIDTRENLPVGDSLRAMKDLVQVQEKVNELQVAIAGGKEPRQFGLEEVEKMCEAREEAAQRQLGDVRRDLERSIRSLELRCQNCENATAGISTLGREVEELRIRVTVEQQLRQQSPTLPAAVTAATQPSPSAPLPVRAMSHTEIRQQLQKYKETQQPGGPF
eukprot:COSAG02_NODE_754_length_17578_cov_97.544825_2_plen_590_part_00